MSFTGNKIESDCAGRSLLSDEKSFADCIWPQMWASYRYIHVIRPATVSQPPWSLLKFWLLACSKAAAEDASGIYQFKRGLSSYYRCVRSTALCGHVKQPCCTWHQCQVIAIEGELWTESDVTALRVSAKWTVAWELGPHRHFNKTRRVDHCHLETEVCQHCVILSLSLRGMRFHFCSIWCL